MIINAGVTDVLSSFARCDTALVLPTLQHMIHWYPRLRQAVYDVHNSKEYDAVSTTTTTIVSRRTRTALRIWVPYSRDPTQPLDFAQLRRGFEFVTFYDKRVMP